MLLIQAIAANNIAEIKKLLLDYERQYVPSNENNYTLMTARRIVHNYESGQSLIKAVFNNDVDGVKKLLLDGTNPNMLDQNNNPILFIACQFGSVDMIQAFLATDGVDIEIENKSFSHRRPLHAAAQFGNDNVVAELLKHGAHVNACWKSTQVSALTVAINGAHVTTVQLLLDNGAETNWQQALEKVVFNLEHVQANQTYWGSTHRKYFMIGKLLIDRGADVTQITIKNNAVKMLLAYQQQPRDERESELATELTQLKNQPFDMVLNRKAALTSSLSLTQHLNGLEKEKPIYRDGEPAEIYYYLDEERAIEESLQTSTPIEQAQLLVTTRCSFFKPLSTNNANDNPKPEQIMEDPDLGYESDTSSTESVYDEEEALRQALEESMQDDEQNLTSVTLK